MERIQVIVRMMSLSVTVRGVGVGAVGGIYQFDTCELCVGT